MMFSKLNFIMPLTGSSTSLKLRDKNNNVIYILKEASCTIRINNNILQIKQNSEALPLNLEFASKTEAMEAHSLLRTALKQLNDILLNSEIDPIKFYTFNPSVTTTIGVDTDIPLPVTVSLIKRLYVNGLIVTNSPVVSYTLNIIEPQYITWKAVNDIALDNTDDITIEYI